MTTAKSITAVIVGTMWIALSSPSLSFARESHQPSDIEIIKSLPGPVEEDVEPIRQEVRRIIGPGPAYSDEALKQAAQVAFDRLLAVRLRSLDAESDRAWLREVNASAEVGDPRHQSRVFSWYDTKARTVTLRVPGELQGTVIEMADRMHELSHALQDLMLQFKKHSFLNDSLDAVRMIINTERDSMRWEWAVMNVFPRDVHLYYLEKIRGQLPIKDWTEKTEIDLSNAHLPRNEYLRAEWQSGRYTARKTYENPFVIYPMVFLVGSSSLGCFGFFVYMLLNGI